MHSPSPSSPEYFNLQDMPSECTCETESYFQTIQHALIA